VRAILYDVTLLFTLFDAYSIVFTLFDAYSIVFTLLLLFIPTGKSIEQRETWTF
jgi:hypothetical protein